MSKKLAIIISLLLVILFLGWAFYESSKPLPGNLLKDEGREHVSLYTDVNYTTNPPTSGKHYADWTKPAVFETPPEDGKLVHSLEHGYIIISYNCQPQSTSISQATPSAQLATDSTDTNSSSSAVINTPECQELINNLTAIFNDKGKSRLIITPRPSLDTKIALTAWRRIDKFDQFDRVRIEKFIDSYRNQGPEKTMEP